MIKTFQQFLGEQLDQPAVSRFADNIESTYGIEFQMYLSFGALELSKIIVPKDNRKGGVGSEVMELAIDFADKHQMRLELTPDSSFGGNVARLKKWYKEFDFVENKGRNKNNAISRAMYRNPQ